MTMKCFRLTLNLIGIIHEPGETLIALIHRSKFPFFFEKIKIDDFMAFFEN